MKHKWILSIVTAGVFFAAADRTFAHHSLSATYQSDKEIKLEGTIVEILLRNPHSFRQVEAPDESGQMQRWSLEWRSSGQLGQQGGVIYGRGAGRDAAQHDHEHSEREGQGDNAEHQQRACAAHGRPFRYAPNHHPASDGVARQRTACGVRPRRSGRPCS